MLKQIICSGQAGSERAALDAAIANHFDHGGFCMRGRLAADGHIDQQYKLISNEQEGLTSIEANVEFSDASVIFYLGSLKQDQEMALLHCIERGHFYKLIDMEITSTDQAAGALTGFVQAHNTGILSVSGPTTAQCPNAYEFSHEVINQLLLKMLPIKPSGSTCLTRSWYQP